MAAAAAACQLRLDSLSAPDTHSERERERRGALVKQQSEKAASPRPSVAFGGLALAHSASSSHKQLLRTLRPARVCVYIGVEE